MLIIPWPTLRRRICLLLCSSPIGGHVEKPIFLIGCGRSGTTMLGRALSRHPALAYLNEPRDIWIKCYPQTDIWSRRAPQRNGKLSLGRADCHGEGNRRLKRGFFFETIFSGKRRILEKLPINSFRLDFLRAIFPDAVFIFLLRDGREVARSIAAICQSSGWYGANDYKWRQLVEYACQYDQFCDLPGLCTEPFLRGLLEWRLSVEAAWAFFQLYPASQAIQVKYEDLLSEPALTLSAVQESVGLSTSDEVLAFGKNQFHPKPGNGRLTPFDDKAKQIAGDLLQRLNYPA